MDEADDTKEPAAEPEECEARHGPPGEDKGEDADPAKDDRGGEIMSLVQRSRPPWRGMRTRSRSRTQEERESQRQAEMVNERTNAHRPWRDAPRATSRTCTPGASSRGRTSERDRRSAEEHPAMVDTPEGRINMGVHTWHILLHMVDAMAPPEEAEYGVTTVQRTNIVNTLADMSPTERLHMLSSFMRMMAILLHDIADVTDEVINSEA